MQQQKEDWTNENIEKIILNYLKNNNFIQDSLDFARNINVTHEILQGSINSLERDEFIKTTQKEEKLQYKLTPAGQEFLEKGSYEYRMFQLIPQEGIQSEDLQKFVGLNDDEFNKGKSYGVKNKLFIIEKEKVEQEQKEESQKQDKSEQGKKNKDKKKKETFKRLKENSIDKDRQTLQQIYQQQSLQSIQEDVLKEIKKRPLFTEIKQKYFEVSKGPKFQTERIKVESKLTQKLIQSGEYKDQQFKQYNWNALGKQIQSGNLHPLMKVRKQMREALLEMGFEEMPTNQYVESCFYNFDALFVPQNHPARDEQDTFFIKSPDSSNVYDQEFLQSVKKVHQEGGFGSIGYQYEFSERQTKKNVFRTHTTAVTSRMLRKLGLEFQQTQKFRPVKMFSIDRVFRNETLDATHLAEFHQIEGVVAQENVGLAHLIGIFTQFFNKLGITKLQFKPTYNPYTEPSLEIHGYHPILKKMVEIGNSGVFRPEMLRPMGLPEDVNVLGWGLGLERPTMIQYGYKEIRELFGYKVNLEMIKSNSITVFK